MSHVPNPSDVSRPLSLALALALAIYAIAALGGWPQEATRQIVQQAAAEHLHAGPKPGGVGPDAPKAPPPPPLWTVGPFAILLLAIAVLPLAPATRVWWESNLHRFYVAGGIYRIPATFSFSAQYGSFLVLYLTVAATALNMDPDERVRRFAGLAIFVAFLAAILSGTRALVVVFPMMLVAYALCGLLRSRVLLIAPVAIVAGLLVLELAAIRPIEYFSNGEQLVGYYTDEFIVPQILEALDNGMFGLGIGASTSGARYALGGTAIDDGPQIFYEVYFAKAAVELGWIGFVAVGILLAGIAARIASTMFAHFGRRDFAVIAPACIYIGYAILMSFKGSVLDTDPGNIFFWLLLGFVIARSRGTERVAADGEAFLLPDEAGASEVR